MHVPFVMAFVTFGTWILGGIFALGRLSPIWLRTVCFSFALVQMSCSIWAGILSFGKGIENFQPIVFQFKWFNIPNVVGLADASFVFSPFTTVMWVVVSTIVVFFSYFSLLDRRSQQVGEVISLPLLGLGALTLLGAANFLTFFWASFFLIFSGYLSISFDSPAERDRSKAAYRYFSLSCFAEAITIAGALLIFEQTKTLNFAEINGLLVQSQQLGQAQIAQTQLTQTTIAISHPLILGAFLLVIGTMFRHLQFPLMQNLGFISGSTEGGIPLVLIAHVVCAPVLLFRLFPFLSVFEDIRYLAIIPLLTGLTAAFFCLFERNFVKLSGYIASFICASIFTAALNFNYQAFLVSAYAGVLSLLFLSLTFSQLPSEERGSKYFALFACLVFAGLPGTSCGWSRFVEYTGHGQLDSKDIVFAWIVLVVKLISDLIMSVAILGVFRDQRWLVNIAQSNMQAKIKWVTIVPLTIAGLLTVSGLTGGNIFSGIVTEDGASQLAWFEKLIPTPSGVITKNIEAQHQIGINSEVLSAILLITVFFLGFGLVTFWLFRDLKKAEDFRNRCILVTDFFTEKFFTKMSTRRRHVSFLWDRIIVPINFFLSKIFTFFDERVVRYILNQSWIRPLFSIQRVFEILDERVIDRKIVDGLATSIVSIGKSLRMVQNGQVQFYFAIGLLVTAAVIFKFIIERV